MIYLLVDSVEEVNKRVLPFRNTAWVFLSAKKKNDLETDNDNEFRNKVSEP